MRGASQKAGKGRWRLRAFVGREGGKARHVDRNFKDTKRPPRRSLRGRPEPSPGRLRPRPSLP